MGQKVNPNIFRIGISKTWNSRWFATGKQYIELLKQDVQIRKFLAKTLNKHLVGRVEIERRRKKIDVIIYTGKPGVVIGKSGEGVDKIKKEIAKIVDNPKIVFDLIIKEVRNPNLSATIVLEQGRINIERRLPFKKAMKKMIDKAKQAGAKGIKVTMSGRLNGVDIARTETLSYGSIPLHTIRADIDYASEFASTIYGSVGIKVWIYKGLIFKKNNKVAQSPNVKGNN